MKKRGPFARAGLIGLTVLLLLAGCSRSLPVITDPDDFDLPYDLTKTVKFEIVMESGAVMEGELYPKIAPITVRNFIKLADDGFYDGLTFHRVVADTLIQGGDPKGDGTGGPGYTILGEFSDNGWNNTLKHKRGVLSMARAADYNSAGSQFFIVLDDRTVWDGEYAAFGKLTSGLKAADAISEAAATDERPENPEVIREINILGN